MSLFAYKGRLADGKLKNGKVTAKTEKDARERLAHEQGVVEVLSMKEQPEQPPQVKERDSAPRAKPLTKLQKMLYLQHGRCFFCGEELRENGASIEHLNPRAKGGKSNEDNEVVCHASLNQTFGSMDLKRKFEFVLKQAGAFRCPM
jgi:hypothetical protein